MTWILLAVFLAGGGLSGYFVYRLKQAEKERDLAELEVKNTREQLAAVGAAATDAQAREKGALYVLEGGLDRERSARAMAARLDDASAASFLRDELSTDADADGPEDEAVPGPDPAAPAPGSKRGDLN